MAMAKKGYVCTTCGSKKQKLTPALEFGFYKRRQQYEEHRCIEGVSDICKKCDAFTFFLNLDDNSSESPDVVLTSGSLKYKRFGRQDKSVSSQGRRDFNWPEVQQRPIYGEISPSSDSDCGRHDEPNITNSLEEYSVYEYSDYDSSFYDENETAGFPIDIAIDDDAKDYETDDEDIQQFRRTETRSSQTLESRIDSPPSNRREKPMSSHNDYPKLKTSSKKKDKKPKNDLPKKVKQKKELLSKLNGMRERLNTEYERAQSELKQLQYDNIVKKQELKQIKRERGGAHYILPEISDGYTKREEQVKSENVTRESQMRRSMKEEKLPKSTPYMESDLTPFCSSLNGGGSTVTEGPTSSRQCLTPLTTQSLAMPRASRGGLKSLNKFPRICYALSSVQRAIYQGFVTDPRSKIGRTKQLALRKGKKPEYVDELPYSQFTTLPCNRKEILYLLDIKPEASNNANVAQELFISRAPVFCPDDDCKRITFIADFNRHLLYDHRALTMERINVRQSKTFYLDSNVVLLNKPKCHILYLIREKVIDTHSKKLRELLPVLVMTSRVRLSEMFGPSSAVELHGVSHQALNAEMFVIWLTSFIPRDHNVIGTICVWSTDKTQLVNSLYVHTSDVYDIRDPQDLCSICSSTSSLVIPGHVVNRMTNHGGNFLAVQIQLY
uniref:GK20473 n=1 Tax=Drosophila willistoni TaxID=7260 RepID=B4N4Y9_DROWI